MNKSEVLSNLNRAKAAYVRFPNDMAALSEIGDALDAATAAMHEQESLSTPETEVDIIKMLVHALQPFARIMTPDYYEDHDPVAVEITIPRELAEKYAKAYEEMIANGEKPTFAKPDLENRVNWPTQILNLDGVNIGDIRYARKAIETISAPDQNTLN